MPLAKMLWWCIRYIPLQSPQKPLFWRFYEFAFKTRSSLLSIVDIIIFCHRLIHNCLKFPFRISWSKLKKFCLHCLEWFKLLSGFMSYFFNLIKIQKVGIFRLFLRWPMDHFHSVSHIILKNLTKKSNTVKIRLIFGGRDQMTRTTGLIRLFNELILHEI